MLFHLTKLVVNMHIKKVKGIRSLDYWREAHKTFFTNELKNINQDFQKDMEVVCEEFELVYK